MATISNVQRLSAGVSRNVDISASGSGIHVDVLDVGTSSPAQLTKTILLNLIALQNGTDFATGTNAHTHDGRYYTQAQLNATSGSALIGDTNTYTNFTPAAATVKGALSGIDTALANSSDGKVKITSADTTREFLNASLTAGAGLSSSITNPGANEQLDFAVNVDSSTIEINADALRVKDAGITNAKIATGIDAVKIGSGAVDNTEFSYLDGVTSGIQAQFTGKVSKSGDTMSGALAMGANKITGLLAGTAATDAINKSQLDAAVSGLFWLNPIMEPDLINATLNAPPGSPVYGDTYIAGATPTGAWATFAGHVFTWSGSTWIDLLGRAVAIGDRFGVSMESVTAAAGTGLSGNDNQIAEVLTATPGSITFTLTAPVNQNAVFVNEVNSTHFGHSYTYSSATTAWIEFSGPNATPAGIGLSYDGNILNVNLGAGIAQLPSDEVGVDVYSGGGLMTTLDNSTSDTSTGAQLAVKLDGSTLAKGSNGVKVATSGITATELAAASVTAAKLGTITDGVTLDQAGAGSTLEVKALGISNSHISASAAIAYSKLNLLASIVNADVATGAAIAYAKLNLSASIVNADISASAAIAYSKLALSNSIVAGDLTALSVTAAKLNSDVAGSGLTQSAGGALEVRGVYTALVNGNAGTVAAGTIVYKNATANQFDVASNAAEATGNAIIGVLKASTVTTATGEVQSIGRATVGSGLTIGARVYASTAGAVTQTAPTATGTVVFLIGIAVSTTEVMLNLTHIAVND
jgi:hypothetical protein